MDQTTQQNAAMVEETTAASHSLAEEAQNLAQMIAQFSTEERRETGEPRKDARRKAA
jgi:methyl-accepting chemotaxis protein